MPEISREVALYYVAKSVAAQAILAAVAGLESERSPIIPHLTLESRQTIAREMRAIAASVDCEQSQHDLAKQALESEVLAVQCARSGGGSLTPIRIPDHFMTGQDGD